MTDQLQGRELDEAVARILGTYMPECDGDQEDSGEGHWVCDGCRQVHGAWWDDFPKHAKVRAYSTDPATQAEMLAHLLALGYSAVCVTVYEGRCEAWCKSPAHEIVRATGPTISEALARLVVAVAAWEAKP